MSIEEILNQLFETTDVVDDSRIKDCIKFIKENLKSPIQEVIFGDEELTKLINKLIVSNNSSELEDYLKSNLHVQNLSTYSFDYHIESKEVGKSFADTDILHKLNLSFGVHYGNLVKVNNMNPIAYVIGWLNGRVDSAIWILSGDRNFTKVYSRIDGSINIYQTQSASVDPHGIWKACERYLTEYKHSATNSGLRNLLMDYEFDLSPMGLPNIHKVDCEVDYDTIKSLFNLGADVKLGSSTYNLGDESICLVSPESKEFLIALSDTNGVMLRSDLTVFNDMKFRILTSLSNVTPSQLVKNLGNGINAIITYNTKPFSVNVKNEISVNKDATESISYVWDFNKVTISKVGSLNYEVNLDLDNESSSITLESTFSAMDLMKSVYDSIGSCKNLPSNQLRYQIALRLLSISKLV